MSAAGKLPLQSLTIQPPVHPDAHLAVHLRAHLAAIKKKRIKGLLARERAAASARTAPVRRDKIRRMPRLSILRVLTRRKKTLTNKAEKKTTGKLFLIPTPIGNDEDLSPRARRLLVEVDLLACEDTRVSALLLARLGLPRKKLISLQAHNEHERSATVLQALEQGEKVAYITDAGMPAISDPGEILVREVLEAGFPLTALPGPNAALTALSVSGLDTRRFIFEGFLPASGAERKARLQAVARMPSTILLHEAPHRLERTLEDLCDAGLAERRICLARELTKTYETTLRLTVAEALAHVREERPRGEYVLVLEGREAWLAQHPELVGQELENIRAAVAEKIGALLAEGESGKTIRRRLQAESGLSRNDFYALLLDCEKKAGKAQKSES